jgi:peptidoglycan-N-acetylglucosamine deacetylase
MALLHYYPHARRDQMKVALTFDDGPNPPRTDQVIEILNSRGVRGTFFVLGMWVERFPQSLERMAKSGHVIGNHGYEHRIGIGDFDRAEAIIANVLGKPSQFIRAPYFKCEAYNQLHPFFYKQIKIIHSDILANDWSALAPEPIVDAVLNDPGLAGGSIIDLHDGSENPIDRWRLARPVPMIEALPAMIDDLIARGFELVGVDEMEFTEPQTYEQRPDNTG